jgi:opacity protein-like surface antigen
MMRRALAALLPLLLAAAPAAAQELADYDYENLSFRGVGFDYGYIWPTKVSAAPQYALRIDLGYLGPGVRLVPTFTYWSSEFKTSELARLADQLEQLPVLQQQGVSIDAADLGTVEWSDISLGLDAHYVWTAPFDLITYAGAGLGLHALNGRGTAIADTFIEDLLDSTTAGLAVLGGVEYQAAPRLRVYGELRYTVMSDVRYPGIRLGAALMIPPARTDIQPSGETR